MAWASKYLSMNSVGVMILLIGGSAGAFGYQYTTGHLFQKVGPHSLMYIILFYALCLLVTYGFMAITVRVFKTKISPSQEEDGQITAD